MEKYGVDTTRPDNEKTAGENTRCPLCGKVTDPNSPTPKCPTHGTAPWEKGQPE